MDRIGMASLFEAVQAIALVANGVPREATERHGIVTIPLPSAGAPCDGQNYDQQKEKTMANITARYEGNTHCTVTDDTGHSVSTAAPKEFGGDGSEYGPTDLVGVALASCMMTVMALWANHHGLDLKGSSATVAKEAHQGRIVGLAARVELPSNVPLDKRAALEEAARGCPVHASLHPDIAAPIEFTYALN